MKLLKAVLLFFTAVILISCSGVDSRTLNSDKLITEFSFESLSVSCSISNNNITAIVPNGTDITNLIATYVTTGESVTINGTTQISGITSNNFTNDVIYRVTAKDGSITDYTVDFNFVNPIILMAANITSGTQQAYETAGIRIFQGIKPDIVLIQQFNYESGTLRDLVDVAFGTNYNYISGSGDIPNGIVSKYPILDSGYWDDPAVSNRNLDWAVIDIPGDKNIFVVSVHFIGSPASDQVDAAAIVANKISALKTTNPNKYYYVVGGTFNGSSAVSSSGINLNNDFDISAPYPVCLEENENTNRSRSAHYDWLILGSTLSQYEVAYSQNNSQSFVNGFVFDTRVFTQTELDYYFSPTLKGDSDSSNMSHMAIIKKIIIE